MSKDFEQAYRELAESEIPDLWDRIEAGLESRSTSGEALPEKREGVAADISGKKRKAVSAGRKFSGKKYKKHLQGKKRIFLRRYLGVAAAAACVAVLIPAAVLLFGMGSGRLRFGGMGAADTTEGIDMAAAQSEELGLATGGSYEKATAESCEESSEEATAENCEESGEATAGEATEGMAAGRTAEDRDTSAEPAQAGGEKPLGRGDNGSNKPTESTQMMDEAADLQKEGQSADAGAGYMQQKQGESSEAAKLESALTENETEGDGTSSGEIVEGTILGHIVIEVTEVQNDFVREEGSLPGTLYTARIREDASGRLAAGEELKVDVPASSSIALPKGGVFEVDLIYRGNDIYGLEKYYRQVRE